MLIDDFTRLVTLKRFSPCFAVNGIAVMGAVATTFAIQAVITPLQPREMLLLPEGERTRERVEIFTESGLLTAGESGQTLGDRISYNGREYEVQKCELWSDGEDTFFKAIAVLVEQDTREVDMEKINAKSIQVTVGKMPLRILPDNLQRNYLRIENKNPAKAAVVKIGADFLTPANEVQKLTFSAIPSAGTWQIGSMGSLITVLPFNADAATIQAQLSALPNCTGIQVTGDYTAGFTLTWAGANANSPQPLVSLTGSGLVSNAHQSQEVQTVTFFAISDAGVFRLRLDNLETADIAFNAQIEDVQTAVNTAGWPAVIVSSSPQRGVLGFIFAFTGYTALNFIQVSRNTLTHSDGVLNEIQTLYGTAIPKSGTFQLQYAGQMTAPITFDANATAIAAALNALSNLGPDPVNVTGTDLVSGFNLEFGIPAGSFPLVTVWNNQLTVEEVGDLFLLVEKTQIGIGPMACAGTVTRTTAGHGNDDVVISASEVTLGIADNEAGLAIPAGAVPGNPLTFSMSVPVQAIYGKGEDEGVILEITEG